MKKLLLFLAFALVMQVASAQINDVYLSSGVVLTGNQWHFDDYSVMEANNGVYVIVTPNGYNYYQLQQFDKRSFELAYADVVYSMKPYIYNNQFGWYIRGHYRNYFYYPNGNIIVMSYEPTFYTFHYDVARLTYLNLRYWHWRTAGLYHHLWHKPHHYHHPPQKHHHNHPHPGHNGQHNRPEPPKNGNSHATQPSRNGEVRRPTSIQTSRSTTVTPSSSRVTVTRSSTSTPSRSTSVSRPATTPSRGTTVTRPATQPSRSTSVTRPATQPSRSTSVTRPATQPSRSTSVTRQVGTSSSRSGGSSRTRR